MMPVLTHLDALVGQILALPAAESPDPGIQVPKPGIEAPPTEVTSGVEELLGWGAYLAAAACVGGILWCAARMAIAHRRGDDSNLSGLGFALAACVLVGSASSVVGALLL